ncbi:MAG: methyltransferase domain-containing protein [bacterium]|nr:methyltransferase domain-containing protein [bacterium]
MNKQYAEILLLKTREDYNLISDEFSRTRQRLWSEIKFLFDNYIAVGEKILDLGCGNGRFFKWFQEKGADYSGVDNSEKLIKIAKKNNPEGNFLVDDALRLSFPEGCFSKVYGIAIFHHIPSVELRLKFLQEAKRILKPNGFLILTVWKFHRPEELYLIFKYALLKIFGFSKLDFGDILDPWGKKTDRYYHCFSERELVILTRSAGFKIKESGIVKNTKENRQNIYLIAQVKKSPL